MFRRHGSTGQLGTSAIQCTELGIILRVLRLEISVNVYITKQFQFFKPLLLTGGGGGGAGEGVKSVTERNRVDSE